MKTVEVENSVDINVKSQKINNKVSINYTWIISNPKNLHKQQNDRKERQGKNGCITQPKLFYELETTCSLACYQPKKTSQAIKKETKKHLRLILVVRVCWRTNHNLICLLLEFINLLPQRCMLETMTKLIISEET